MFRQFALVRQVDQSDCGAASLATVAMHYRIPVSLQAMRDLAGTDRVGTNLLGLMEAAKRLGFWTKGVKIDADSLSHVNLPAIAHVKTSEGLGHFVVLHKVRRRNVVVADPAHGVLKQSREEFTRRFTGYLLLLAPDPSDVSSASQRRPMSPWRRYVGLIAFHKWGLIQSCVCAVVMTMLGLSTSFFVQHLVDSVLVCNEVSLLNALGVGMVTILVFRMLFGLLRQYLLAHVARRVDLFLVSRYARHVLRLPMRFFETRRTGEILSRVNDATKVRQAISGTALSLVIDGMTVTLSLTALWMYDAPLALVATFFAPLLVIGVLLHHIPTKRISREIMEQAADLSAHLVEDISSVETVKAFGLEQARSVQAESKLLRVVQSGFSMQKLGMSMSSAAMLITGMAGISVLWYGGHRVMTGALTIGQLMFFNTLVAYILGPLESLASVNLQIQEALVALDRLYQVMDLDVEQGGDASNADFAGPHTAIEFHDVSFKYGCRDEVLQDVNLRIPVGAKVAIVGESGSGKSTLLKLLMRFYDPSEGRVLCDGVDLRDIDLDSLRSKIGFVSQDPFIFNGTLRENIALGCPGATMTQIAEASCSAGLNEFIAGLPDRYETIIGERGANLSGGQRQRLAIARALLRRPEIVIFDEATSHLDTATERSIQKSLETILTGKTAILVAHRLSTIKDADLIYVMHDGRVVEQGTHHELVTARGKYAELSAAQTGLHQVAAVSAPVAAWPPSSGVTSSN